MTRSFDVTLRGYDCHQVDRLIDQAERALRTESRYARKPALDALRLTTFDKRLRGYDREQVNHVVFALTEQLS